MKTPENPNELIQMVNQRKLEEAENDRYLRTQFEMQNIHLRDTIDDLHAEIDVYKEYGSYTFFQVVQAWLLGFAMGAFLIGAILIAL
jgi:hypothetical protein